MVRPDWRWVEVEGSAGLIPAALFSAAAALLPLLALLVFTLLRTRFLGGDWDWDMWGSKNRRRHGFCFDLTEMSSWGSTVTVIGTTSVYPGNEGKKCAISGIIWNLPVVHNHAGKILLSFPPNHYIDQYTVSIRSDWTYFDGHIIGSLVKRFNHVIIDYRVHQVSQLI